MRNLIFTLAILPAVLGLPGSPDEYFDISGTGTNEWRLAFRGTAHTRKSVYKAYTEGYDGEVDADCKIADFARTCTTHYRNDDALDNWWMVDEVLFGVIKDGAMVKSFKFNGTGSDYLSWFDQANYLESCYNDLKTKDTNYFGISGHSGSGRRFFINHDYNKCDNNEGWFVAIDDDEYNCNWERNQGDPPILKFAAGPRLVNWNDAGAHQADSFVVFIKYYNYPGQPTEYFDILDKGEKEWRLAFRATPRVGQPVWQAYHNGAGIPADVDEGCKGCDWSAECSSHYRNNDALSNYKWQQIDQVLFGIVSDNAIVKTIAFNAHGTNYINWFHHARVLDSCWADFKLGKNVFSIPGGAQRRFFINHRYGGCANDVGWVVAIDGPSCDWERFDQYPVLRYAPGLKNVNWNDNAHVKDADAFVVFIRYKVFVEQ